MKTRNSIKFLMGVSVVGIIGTAVLSIRATKKAVHILEMTKDESIHDLSMAEKGRLLLPTYLPVILSVSGTILCVMSMNHISKKSQGRILAAYSLLNLQFQEYRNSVKTLYGQNTDADIMRKVESKNEVIFVEDLLGKPFVSTIENVQRAEYELNRLFILRGYASVNDFLTFIGVQEKGLGERFGWSFDIGVDYGYEWIDFSHEKIDYNGREAYLIHYPFEPVLNFLMDY